LNYPFHNLVGRFQDEEFLTGRQRHDGIGRNFDVFDQIGIYNQRDMVQPSQLYQGITPIGGSRVYRQGAEKDLCFFHLGAPHPNKVFCRARR
jgi:hypothetical protein